VETRETCATLVSSADVNDDEAFAPLVDQIDDDLASVGGDGAYDKAGVREKIETLGATPRIPPRRDAQLQKKKKHRRRIANVPLINVMMPSGVSKNCAAHRPTATYPRPEYCGNRKPIIIAARRRKQPCIVTKPSSAPLFVRASSTIRPRNYA